jgi:hypothetical protein
VTAPANGVRAVSPNGEFAPLRYGGVPVPWSVSWSAEDRIFLDVCAYAGGLALCQTEARGRGKPQFGKPHANRQRRAIAEGRCDLCGRSLDATTKVSLSHAGPVLHAARPGDILQVEPLLHRACATASMLHCPSLKRDIGSGTLHVRQVRRYAVQMAIMTSEYCAQIAGDQRRAFGHAKVQLLAWTDRDARWLENR